MRKIHRAFSSPPRSSPRPRPHPRTSPYRQLEPFDDDDAAAELNAIVRGIHAASTSQWHVHFEIVTAVRRLVVHHTELPTAKQTSDVLVPFVVQQARSARSSVARNGLLALGDIVATCATVSDRPDCGVVRGVSDTLNSVATTILELCAPSKPKIIRQTAAELLDAACGADRLRVALAPELLRHIDHRNSEVVSKAAVSCAKCVEGMSKREITSELDKHALLPLLHKVGENTTARGYCSPSLSTHALPACVVSLSTGYVRNLHPTIPVGHHAQEQKYRSTLECDELFACHL